MMKKVLSIAILTFCAILLTSTPDPAFGAQKFGLIFEVSGNATLINSKGKTKKLMRSKHILSPVRDGDTIALEGAGKIVVVSIENKTGYELTKDASIKIDGGKVRTIKGIVNVKEGYVVPKGGAKGPIGAIVLRSTVKKTCIKLLSPINTSVPSLSPTLRWENTCDGSKTVSVMVLENRRVIYEKVTDNTSEKIPSGILNEGVIYRWLIDSGPATGIVDGGTFTTLSKEVSADLRRLYKINKNNPSLPEKLSYIFILMENDLREIAEAELLKLQKEFPGNEFIQELREKNL
jgi:hypothetical protein